MANNPNAIKEPVFDKVFYIVTFVILCLFLVTIIYPLWFVLMASFSDAQYVNDGTLLFYPRGFTTLGYERTLTDRRRHPHRHLLHHAGGLCPQP